MNGTSENDGCLWNVETFKKHKILKLIKNIYINTWGIVKLISGVGLWTWTVLLILMIVVLKEDDKTMSIMSDYFRNCSNKWIFSRPSKNEEKYTVHTIDHYVPCYIWSINSLSCETFLRNSDPYMTSLGKDKKIICRNKSKKLILLSWLEVTIAVLQRLFNIHTSNLEVVKKYNKLFGSRNECNPFSVSKALSDQVCNWCCICITVSIQLLQFYTFLFNPIGTQHFLT